MKEREKERQVVRGRRHYKKCKKFSDLGAVIEDNGLLPC